MRFHRGNVDGPSQAHLEHVLTAGATGAVVMPTRETRIVPVAVNGAPGQRLPSPLHAGDSLVQIEVWADETKTDTVGVWVEAGNLAHPECEQCRGVWTCRQLGEADDSAREDPASTLAEVQALGDFELAVTSFGRYLIDRVDLEQLTGEGTDSR